MTTLALPALPFALTPSPADRWEVSGGVVRGTAGARTDFFVDPGSTGGSDIGAASMLNGATALGVPPEGDYQLSAKVSIDHLATFDAGVLMLWADERNWAKLCFERSPDDEPMIVSVVTRGVSDDANGFVVEGRSVWLRVSRIDSVYAYHASTDGRRWSLVRVFALAEGAPTPVSVGLEVQSPTGEGCVAEFEDIRFTHERLADLRDGS